ncbi:MAG: thioredoxin domain-containing protein [Chitinophagales bacterium]|nr:thioredoxin domain-containing protein [Chitinophagales bacterium]MDW8272798.1 thioredoxin domain-containing protein [Chitinophagales bacterium]
MRTFLIIFLTVNVYGLFSQNIRDVSPDEFEKLIAGGSAQLIDVRTPEEFAEKHIKGATNLDIRESSFEATLSKLNKDKPIYFYCLSGGRSNRAAQKASSLGFKEVYNLKGGILAWGNAGKPVVSPAVSRPTGMTEKEYLQRIKGPKLVLVDFNAVWCGPCKLLKPRIKNIMKQKGDIVELLDIDVDKNPIVANYMNVSGIPLLILYKQGKEVWRKMGLAEESEIIAAIEKAK